jgi:DNA invertase Pin-like site-specific DNA recombinase
VKKNKSRTSNKAVAYIRVSTEEQSTSMDIQETKLRAYCALKDFDLVAILSEPGVSGKIPLYSRPEGARIQELIGRQECSHVVALKLDRLFRNAGDALNVSEEWIRRGVNLHIVDMSGSAIDTGSPQGRMFFTMLAGFAEFERSLIAERTSAALQQKKANGQVYCGTTPFGVDAVGGRLVENPGERLALELMREMRARGLSLRDIASRMRELGVPAKEGGDWHPWTIARVLAA